MAPQPMRLPTIMREGEGEQLHIHTFCPGSTKTGTHIIYFIYWDSAKKKELYIVSYQGKKFILLILTWSTMVISQTK
jgi:hypothetical protein